jgi:hypothetical protein
VASAVNDAAREVGGAVGIAVLGSLLTSGYRDGVAPHTEALPPEAAHGASDSLAFVVHGADRLGPAGGDLLAVARDSFVGGMHTAMWVAAAIMAAGAVVTHLLHRGEQPGTSEPGASEPGTSEPGTGEPVEAGLGGPLAERAAALAGSRD